MNKNRNMGIRISEKKLNDYNEFCSKLNSVMSLRVRKFIELELEGEKVGKDILTEIERIVKHGK